MKYRVAYSIGKTSGHGSWRDSFTQVKSWVDSFNKEYGYGTHWVEFGGETHPLKIKEKIELRDLVRRIK